MNYIIMVEEWTWYREEVTVIFINFSGAAGMENSR